MFHLIWLVLALSPARVTVRDLPESHWHEGSVVVHAPIADVRRWMKDYARWTERFPDIESAKIIESAPDHTVVSTRSRILGRELKLDLRDLSPDLQVYTGVGPSVTVQGKTFFESLGPNETRVVMQTSAEVHGALKFFATESMLRSRAYRKLEADLGALLKLEH